MVKVDAYNSRLSIEGRFLFGHSLVDSCMGAVFVLDDSLAMPSGASEFMLRQLGDMLDYWHSCLPNQPPKYNLLLVAGEHSASNPLYTPFYSDHLSLSLSLIHQVARFKRCMAFIDSPPSSPPTLEASKTGSGESTLPPSAQPFVSWQYSLNPLHPNPLFRVARRSLDPSARGFRFSKILAQAQAVADSRVPTFFICGGICHKTYDRAQDVNKVLYEAQLKCLGQSLYPFEASKALFSL